MASAVNTTSTVDGDAPPGKVKTSILHRTPWTPPVAIAAKGIYIQLEDGREVIDAVGGAAVVCIGSGHPVVQKAITDQVNQLTCLHFFDFRQFCGR